MTTGHYICDQCGCPVGRYITLFGEGWMHVDGTEAADCDNFRGDREWKPALQASFGLIEGGQA
jgi:hypothetical protein